MRILFAILVMPLLLAACAKYTATRPDTSIQQTQADTDACSYEAFKSSAQIDGPSQSAVQATLKAKCMQSKGYNFVAD